jgi:hypothetical protein
MAGGRNSTKVHTSSRSIEALNWGSLANSRANKRSAFAAESSQRTTKFKSPGPVPSINTCACNGRNSSIKTSHSLRVLMPNEAAGDCQLNLAGIRAEVRGQGRRRGPVHVGADTSVGLFRRDFFISSAPRIFGCRSDRQSADDFHGNLPRSVAHALFHR